MSFKSRPLTAWLPHNPGPGVWDSAWDASLLNKQTDGVHASILGDGEFAFHRPPFFPSAREFDNETEPGMILYLGHTARLANLNPLIPALLLHQRLLKTKVKVDVRSGASWSLLRIHYPSVCVSS